MALLVRLREMPICVLPRDIHGSEPRRTNMQRLEKDLARRKDYFWGMRGGLRGRMKSSLALQEIERVGTGWEHVCGIWEILDPRKNQSLSP